jgi:polyhydroxyalkanoate synthesis regulator phasin
MKLSARTVKGLGQIVTGDNQLSPYCSGPALVDFFNEYGADNYYGQGFPSRWKYAEEQIRKLNNTPSIARLIVEILDPRNFLGTDFDQEAACNYLNEYLKFDGHEVSLVDGIPKVRDLSGSWVELRHPFEGSDDEAHHFIDEQIAKASEKIQAGDYDGAITNARSLIEAVLRELDRQLNSDLEPYDGDVTKLYRRVQKQIGLDPARPDLDSPLKQVLSGLNSIVVGIAGISNKMGDRHVRTYKPEKRHAVLVVNAAKTLSDFLFETYNHSNRNMER